jgi:glutamine synthetase
MDQEEAILMVLKNYIRKSKAIRFEGNNYSDEWKAEAKERGLNNFPTTPEALDVLGKDLAKNFYGKSGVMSPLELEAFYLVQLHTYNTKLNIEANTLAEMVSEQVLPAVLRQQTELAQNIAALKAAGVDEVGFQKDLLKRLSKNISQIGESLEKLEKALEKAHHNDDVRAEADVLCHKVRPQMDNIREAVDDLESIVDDQYWPLVKYREMLVVR